MSKHTTTHYTFKCHQSTVLLLNASCELSSCGRVFRSDVDEDGCCVKKILNSSDSHTHKVFLDARQRCHCHHSQISSVAHKPCALCDIDCSVTRQSFYIVQNTFRTQQTQLCSARNQQAGIHFIFRYSPTQYVTNLICHFIIIQTDASHKSTTDIV